jgi:hypothetical protein
MHYEGDPSELTRFKKGNPGGPGQTLAKRAKRQNAVFRRAITDEDIVDIARNLVMQAKCGNVKAAKIILDKCLPKDGKEDTKKQIAQILLVMPDDGRAGGTLYDADGNAIG